MSRQTLEEHARLVAKLVTDDRAKVAEILLAAFKEVEQTAYAKAIERVQGNIAPAMAVSWNRAMAVAVEDIRWLANGQEEYEESEEEGLEWCPYGEC